VNLRKEFREFINSPWPWIIAAVIAIGCGFLGGCATFTEQVYTPEVNPEAVERCVIVYQGTRWNMGKDGYCPGWAAI